MMKMRFKTDLRLLDRKEQDVKRNAQAGAREAADLVKTVIKRNWSKASPSSEGQPPAVDTGKLDGSIFIEKQGRDVLGRFAGKDAAVYHVTIDTVRGPNPDKTTQYAAALDDQDGKLNRPFVDRAVDEVG